MLLIAIIFFSISIAQNNDQSSKHFNIQLLAPGVWAVINNDETGYAICNAGIIDLGNKTIVFDAFISPTAAEDLKKTAEQLTHKPVTFLINSHFHNDHIRGNQVFAPGTHIIGTQWTRDAIISTEPLEQKDEITYVPKEIVVTKEKLKVASSVDKPELQMWRNYYNAINEKHSALRITPPDITFKDSMWIYGSERNVKLIECKNGHTASDAILVLPKEGITFMGDDLFSKRHPWFGDGNPDSLMNILKKFEEDVAIKIYVPGHGPVTDKIGVKTLEQYITDLQQIVRKGINNNLPDSVIENTPIPVAYSNWWFKDFYKPNITFLCSKMRK